LTKSPISNRHATTPAAGARSTRSAPLPATTPGVPVLGSAADAVLVERLFRQQGVTVVFHAAAYKHVPLVEANPLAGLANNVLSTRVVCRAACAAGVNEVVLISTDKAVRPTNVMGASKRVAELVVPGPRRPQHPARPPGGAEDQRGPQLHGPRLDGRPHLHAHRLALHLRVSPPTPPPPPLRLSIVIKNHCLV
jgi:hypothetical protein